MKNFIRHSILFILTTAFSLLFLPSLFAGDTEPLTTKKQANEWIKKQPVRFIENKGQMTDMNHQPVPFVLYKVQTHGMNVYITEEGLTYVFTKNAEKKKEKEESLSDKIKIQNDVPKQLKTEWNRIDMALLGADIKKENVITEDISNDFSQYFLSHCSNGIKEVHSFQKITIKNIYPGIDWVLYNSNEKGFKYDFIVHPGADYKQIKLVYSSLNPLQLDEVGNIKIHTKIGTLTENAPTSFLDGKEIFSQFTQTLNVKNKHAGYDTQIQFSIPGMTTHSSELIIDPQLAWATFYGGYGFDDIISIATDTTGNLFLTGRTSSIDFPMEDAGTFFQGIYAGSTDAFILKFDNHGVLMWATYYGGSVSEEVGESITTDIYGNVFVTGHTYSNDFPTYDAGTFYKATFLSYTDAFILKFDNSGNRLWATCYGGSKLDFTSCIATDIYGNVFITGRTTSTDFPTLNAGTFFRGAFSGGYQDAFISKFDNYGNLLWSTYYGGSGNEVATSITTDTSGNVLVTGPTESTNFPTKNAGTFFQGTHAVGATTANLDIFILKFNNLGSRIWATYYGGAFDDYPFVIKTDASNNIFVLGYAFDLPLEDAGTFFRDTCPSIDGFILKFDAAGNRTWATLLGGVGNNAYSANINFATDKCSNLYISLSTDTAVVLKPPYDNGYYDSTRSGYFDIFLLKFTNSGNLLWTTYLGGIRDEYRCPLAMDQNDNLFIATGARTSGVDIDSVGSYALLDPGGGAYYDGAYDETGLGTGYILKFNDIPLSASSTSINVTNAGCTCSGIATVNPGTSPPYSYLWSNGETTQTVNHLCPGMYTVTITDTAKCNQQIIKSVTVDSSGAIISVNSPAVCIGDSATVIASGITHDGTETYNWSSGITSTGLNTGTASPSITTTYTVTGSSSQCSGTALVTVTVHPLPVVSYSQDPDSICIYNSSFTLSGGLPSGGIYSGTGATANNFDPDLAGIGLHTIIYTYTDSYACSNTSEQNIFVSLCTGIIEPPILNNQLTIYPNPYSDFTNIVYSLAHKSAVVIEIYNLIGERMATLLDNSQTEGEHTCRFSAKEKGLNAGVYFVKISVDGNAIIKKVVEL